jgi:hypothetical protein
MSRSGAWRRLLREPTLHFFVAGALLFLIHRLVVGDPRVIAVTPGVKGDLARRLADNAAGRTPTPAELEEAVRAWTRDEALYREALREGLDRDDGTIRTVLADRMRARASAGLPKRTPTEAQLATWLDGHRSLYETARRYDYETVVFSKTSSGAAAARERFAGAIESGKDPRTLGRPIVGGNLTDEDLKQRLGGDLAARIEALPVGRWQRLESDRDLLLARLNKVDGGLPDAGELQQRMVVDWQFADRKQAAERAVDEIVSHYRVEPRAP